MPPAARDDASPLRALATQGLAYTAAALATRALSLVMVPVYAHLLGPSDLGVLELVDTLDLVVIAAFSTALTDPLIRHLHDAPDERTRDVVRSTALLAILGAGALLATVGVAVSPWLSQRIFHGPSHADLVAWTFLSITSQAAVEVPFASLRAEGRTRAVITATFARAVLGLGLNIALIVGLRLGPRGAVLSNFASATVQAALMVGLTLRRTGLRFDPRVLTRMLSFGWPLVPGALAMIALGHSRSYVLNRYCTLAEVGVWAFGYRFGALVTQALGQPLRAAWTARMYALWEHTDGPDRYRRAGTWLAALFAWAAATLSITAPPLVAALAPRTFARAVPVVAAVAFSYALREMAAYFRNGLLVARDARAVARIEPALAVVDLALSIALIARFGLTGALVASPLVFALYAVALHHAVRAVLPVRYEYARIGACGGLAVALAVIGQTMHLPSRAFDLAVRAALVALYPVAVMVWVLDRDERAWLREVARTIGLRGERPVR